MACLGARSPRTVLSKGDPHRAETILGTVIEMRKEHDFTKAQNNPYSRRLKRQVTLRIDEGTISYFTGLARKIGVPYQTLINLY